MKKIITKHSKLFGYLVAIIVSFVVGVLCDSAFIVFDLFILFALIRIAWLLFCINGAESNIFSYMFSEYIAEQKKEDTYTLRDNIVDALTGNSSRITKREILDILPKKNITVSFECPLIVDLMLERQRLKFEFTLLLWVIGISILIILSAAIPFLRDI